jgi:DNA-binding CsgD family transcriptional regulator
MGSLRSSQAALGRVHLLEGDFSSSQLLMSELRGLVAMLSPEPSVVDTPYEAELFVWMGAEAKAREIIDSLINRWGVLLGKSVLEDWGWMSLAVLENSLGNYEQALEAAGQAVDHDHLPWSSQALPEAVEAAVRTHNDVEVQLRLGQLRERVAESRTPWSEGLLARSEAICAHGAEADQHFRNAVALLARSGIRTEHARSVLLYGEWLRREGRKLDARVQLKEALALFNAMGSRLFAQRCEIELRATGARIRRDAGDAKHLTPQEQQVAELAASGMTNKEISTKLFIGESTVEFHMTKVFRKLEIRSRRQLRTTLQREPSDS